MHKLDASFRLKKQAAAERRRRRRQRLVGGCAAAVILAGAAAFVLFQRRPSSDLDENLKPVEASAELPKDASVYVPTLIDLPGDPMWITLSGESGGEAKKTSVARPAALEGEGVSPQDRSAVGHDDQFERALHDDDPVDAAGFRLLPGAARGRRGRQAPTVEASLAPGAAGRIPTGAQGDGVSDAQGGWGETIGNGRAPLPAFRKTEIENNTSVATVIPEDRRFEQTQESFVKILDKRSIEDVVLDNHYPAADARAAAQALKSLFGRDSLEAGDVVAMRGFRAGRDAGRAVAQAGVGLFHQCLHWHACPRERFRALRLRRRPVGAQRPLQLLGRLRSGRAQAAIPAA